MKRIILLLGVIFTMGGAQALGSVDVYVNGVLTRVECSTVDSRSGVLEDFRLPFCDAVKFMDDTHHYPSQYIAGIMALHTRPDLKYRTETTTYLSDDIKGWEYVYYQKYKIFGAVDGQRILGERYGEVCRVDAKIVTTQTGKFKVVSGRVVYETVQSIVYGARTSLDNSRTQYVQPCISMQAPTNWVGTGTTGLWRNQTTCAADKIQYGGMCYTKVSCFNNNTLNYGNGYLINGVCHLL